MKKIDLHIHTILSDGDYDIQDIINLSKKNECFTIAITDHEVIRDYSFIAKENSIDVFNGIEFNTSEKGMHILGYGIRNIERVQKEMDLLHKDNEQVSFELIRKLQQRNYDISEIKIFDYFADKNIYYKYLDKRHIVRYLIYKGYVKNVLDAYNNLIGRGTDLYIPLKKIIPEEIINLISECGGISVLAHPDTLNLNKQDLNLKINELVSYGLNGIEIENGNIKLNNRELYIMLAQKYKILKTVGSDFHTADNNIGINIENEFYEEFKSKIKSLR